MPRDFSEDGAAGAGSQGIQHNSGGIDTGFHAPATPAAGPGVTPDMMVGMGGGLYGGGGGGGGGGYTAPPQKTPQQIEDEKPWFQKAGSPMLAPVGSDEWKSQFTQDTGGFNRVTTAWARGGAIPEGDNDYDGNGSPGQEATMRALSNIEGVLAFGRKLHGLGNGAPEGAVQTAARMPSIPGNQSESGIPPVRPEPGRLPPTANPFGKRTENEDGQMDNMEMAANMPVRPASQSESGIPPAPPGPGTLPPTANPFGKRVENEEDDSAPAIDTEEDVA